MLVRTWRLTEAGCAHTLSPSDSSSLSYLISCDVLVSGVLMTVGANFLCYANALSLVIVILTWALLGVQARLEEVHMRSLHGDAFDHYKQKTPRWL